MRFVLEPSELSSLLKKVLIYKSKSLLEYVNVRFEPEGVSVRDVTAGTFAVMAEFSKQHFLEYECEGEGEVVVFPSDLIDLVKLFRGESVTVETDGEALTLTDGERTIRRHLMEPVEQEFKLKVADTNYGIVLERMLESDVRVLVDSSELTMPIAAQTYTFFVEGGDLKVKFEYGDMYDVTLKLPIISKDSLSDGFRASFHGPSLLPMLENLNGEVWLLISGEALNVSETTETYKLSYALASVEEV